VPDYIGIDIGGTKTAVILGKAGHENNDLIIVGRDSFATKPNDSFEIHLNTIFARLIKLLEKNGKSAEDICRAGIICGGPLDSKKGVLLSPPNIHRWHNIPIVELVEKKLGVPARLQNDADACAAAEWKYGAARGYSNIIFLTFGTGMGAGIILDGKPYCGAGNMAGEVGHIRLSDYGPVGHGKAGSFEGFCSGGGIAQLARMMVIERIQSGRKVSFCRTMEELPNLNAKMVAEAAMNGDPLAGEIYRISGQFLGKGLAILIDIFNPEIIVIGSIFFRSHDLLWPAARRELFRESIDRSRKGCRIVPSALGERLSDYAALTVAITGDKYHEPA